MSKLSAIAYIGGCLFILAATIKFATIVHPYGGKLEELPSELLSIVIYQAILLVCGLILLVLGMSFNILAELRRLRKSLPISLS